MGSPGKPAGPARLEALIRRALRAVLRRPLILAGVLAAATAAGIASLRVLPFEFLPPVDTGEILVTARLPAASSVAAAASVGEAVAARLLTVRGVSVVHARAGSESDDVFSLADPALSPDVLHAAVTLAEGRRETAAFIAGECRKALAGAGCEISVDLPPGLAAPLLGLADSRKEIRVTGAGQDQARERALRVLEDLEGSGAAAAAAISPHGESPGLRLVPDRAAMARAGVEAASLALAARAALDGIVAARLPGEGRDLDVRVLADPAAAGSGGAGQAGGVGGIMVRGRGGGQFRLSGLAAIVEATAAPALARADRKDAVSVLFSPPVSKRGRERQLARDGLQAVLQAHPEAELLETSAIRQAMVPLGLALVLVVVLLYLVLGVQFESFLLPVFLLACLPLSFSGIFVGLALAGKEHQRRLSPRYHRAVRDRREQHHRAVRDLRPPRARGRAARDSRGRVQGDRRTAAAHPRHHALHGDSPPADRARPHRHLDAVQHGGSDHRGTVRLDGAHDFRGAPSLPAPLREAGTWEVSLRVMSAG